MEANNMAAMREALEFIKLASDDYEQYGTTKAGALDVIYEKACAALAEPSRNCDVGTADEQLPRFVAALESAHRCFVDRRSKIMLSVFSRWAQMPYDEGCAK